MINKSSIFFQILKKYAIFSPDTRYHYASHVICRVWTSTLLLANWPMALFDEFWWLKENGSYKMLKMYSHLSNKRDVMLTEFIKFHPAQNKNPPCTFIDFNTKL